MNGYTKIFGSLLDSTVWQEDLATKVLWITMLVMVNKNGYVRASIPGLAKRAGVSLEDCEASLAKLQAPDAYSQSKIADGRRIKAIDGGWLIINYENYRHKLDADEQREKNRIRQAEWRMSQKNVTERDSHTLSQNITPVTPHNAECDIATAAVTVTEKEKSKNRALRTFTPPSIEEVSEYCKERNNEVDPIKFHAYYTSADWFRGHTKIRNWKACVQIWERNNYGGVFRGGYQPPSVSKNQQRVINNRAAILVGLGISPMPGQCEPSLQDRDASGGNPDMATRLLKGKS